MIVNSYLKKIIFTKIYQINNNDEKQKQYIQYFMNIENDGKELTINNILIEYK